MLCYTIFAILAVSAQFLHLSTPLSFDSSDDISNDNEFSSQSLDSDNATTCGELLSSSSGTIAYKQFQKLTPNERCVWVIRASNATTYSVGIFNLGFPYSGPEHQLVVAGFSLGQSMYQFSPKTNGLYNLKNTSVLVIAFSTGPNVTAGATGFVLQYNAYNTAQRNRYSYYNYNSPSGDQNAVPSLTSRDIIVSGPRGSIKYPNQAEFYNNFELSTFVFGLSDNVYKPNSKISAKVIVSGLEGCSYDYIKIYSFNPYADFEANWELDGQICDYNRTTNLRSNDLFMLVFQSDSSQQSSGFRINYNYE